VSRLHNAQSVDLGNKAAAELAGAEMGNKPYCGTFSAL
jgi:hypothetical protein